jgi:hypothetical protein
MSRSRHISLDRVETVTLGRSQRLDAAAQRRATLEEALAAALADGDAETASRLRDELAAGGDE